MANRSKISFDWDKKSIEKEEPGFDHSGKSEARNIPYTQAIYETLEQILAIDSRVFIMGQGVDDPSGMFGATLNLHKKYGSQRIFDTPLSEDALTGVAVGAALVGMRPIYMHNRPDFLLLAMDQIVNHASKWRYMFGGRSNVPIVIWAVIGRGWGSGAQHSQALQGLFMHVPGLKLVMPSTPYDAKGLLVSSVLDDDPVVFIEHRWAFKHTGYVPDKLYAIPFGKGVIRKEGGDVTIVGASYMVIEALRAAEELRTRGIEAEVIDLRTLNPLDEDIILTSLKKTGRLIIVDTGWKTAGVTAEIAAMVSEKGLNFLKKPVKRIAAPDIPTPSGYVLERKFYPGVREVVNAAVELAE
ncbi:MAG: alpha-ketoacid dehydrogenase subunit beta [Candidatus Omnitrophica bacterium]|nr:alpha-ketoacid dehydrogenase subunit beta [Candidatus Omnitrophota bacterium]